MRAIGRRIQRLEVGLLPPTETEESRRLHEIVFGIRRRRAERLGLPKPVGTLGEIILPSRERWRTRQAGSEVGQ